MCPNLHYIRCALTLTLARRRVSISALVVWPKSRRWDMLGKGGLKPAAQGLLDAAQQVGYSGGSCLVRNVSARRWCIADVLPRWAGAGVVT